MRNILAVAVLGASLALSASAALAGSEFDYSDRQPVQSVTQADQSQQGAPSGFTAPTVTGPDLGGWNK